MSGTKPSLRHGLPYGWWRSVEFWMTLTAWGSAIGGFALIAFVVLLWWGIIP